MIKITITPNTAMIPPKTNLVHCPHGRSSHSGMLVFFQVRILFSEIKHKITNVINPHCGFLFVCFALIDILKNFFSYIFTFLKCISFSHFLPNTGRLQQVLSRVRFVCLYRPHYERTFLSDELYSTSTENLGHISVPRFTSGVLIIDNNNNIRGKTNTRVIVKNISATSWRELLRFDEMDFIVLLH